jgi:hypothetical protein
LNWIEDEDENEEEDEKRFMGRQGSGNRRI